MCNCINLKLILFFYFFFVPPLPPPSSTVEVIPRLSLYALKPSSLYAKYPTQIPKQYTITYHHNETNRQVQYDMPDYLDWQ